MSGTGSTWNADDFYVGRSGSGNSLTIQNGGHVSSGAVRTSIGEKSSAANNTATVSGTGSTWTTGGVFYVGDQGSGNALVVEAGGQVVSPFQAFIGWTSTVANNTATVTGTGSEWTISGLFYVGAGGDNCALTVADGALVSAPSVTFANSAVSTGNGIHLNGTAGSRGTLQTSRDHQGRRHGHTHLRRRPIHRDGQWEPAAGLGTGDVQIASGGAFIDTQSFATNITVAMQGAGGLNKLGSGNLTLSGTNAFTGGTVVTSGTLTQGVSGAFVANTSYQVDGGTLDLNNFPTTMSSLSGTGGTVALGSAVLTVNQAGNTTRQRHHRQRTARENRHGHAHAYRSQQLFRPRRTDDRNHHQGGHPGSGGGRLDQPLLPLHDRG